MSDHRHEPPAGLLPDARLYNDGPWGAWWLSVRDGRAYLSTYRPWVRTALLILGTHAYAFDTARALEELRHART